MVVAVYDRRAETEGVLPGRYRDAVLTAFGARVRRIAKDAFARLAARRFAEEACGLAATMGRAYELRFVADYDSRT